MIDLTLLRKEPEQIKALILKKEPTFDVEKLITLDQQVRTLTQEIETLRSKKNELAKQAAGGLTDELRNQSIELGKLLKTKEKECKC